MATLATAAAYSNVLAKNLTGGVFSIVETLEIDTDTLTNTSTAATTTAVAQNDIVRMVRIDAGVTVLDVRIVYDALGGSTTVDVGDGDNDDYYIAAQDPSSAGTTRAAAATFFPKTYSSADTIDIVFEGGNPSGTITLIVLCTSDVSDVT